MVMMMMMMMLMLMVATTTTTTRSRGDLRLLHQLRVRCGEDLLYFPLYATFVHGICCVVGQLMTPAKRKSIWC
ncbi:unnamed protein product [Amoebophrya sp. A25]|nr:unnamed protein product [Amoebophrya sp. A25]|eukprot:GSA25T00020745001.1